LSDALALARCQRPRATARADVRFEMLDLANRTSIKAFAKCKRAEGIDLHVNNAGAMAPPTRKVTADGFELERQSEKTVGE
jgi:NAD(P)-dependent dehydrogenase (short-subunit alcohol dehydrogenase family)